MKATAHQMRLDGATRREISKALGATRVTVARWVKDIDLKGGFISNAFKLSESQIREIRSLRESGIKLVDIGIRVGCSSAAVRSHTLDIQVECKSIVRRKFGNDIKISARTLRATGMSYAMIGRELGVGTTSAENWTKDVVYHGKQATRRLTGDEIERARALRSQGATLRDVADAIGCSEGTALNHTDDIEVDRSNQCLWSSDIMNFVDGLLMSDAGCYSRSSRSASIAMTQHVDHEDWVDSIISFFKKFDIECSINYSAPSRKVCERGELVGHVFNKGRHKHIVTANYAVLRRQRDRWYPNGIKIVPKDLDVTSVAMLANWYMGDGSYHLTKGDVPEARIATPCFTEEEHDWLIAELETKLGIHAIKDRTIKRQPTLLIQNRNAAKFMDLLREYILKVAPSFAYKVPPDPWQPQRCLDCDVVINRETCRRPTITDIAVDRHIRYCDKCRKAKKSAQSQFYGRRLVFQKKLERVLGRSLNDLIVFKIKDEATLKELAQKCGEYFVIDGRSGRRDMRAIDKAITESVVSSLAG